MEMFRVVEPGPFTTIQDLGRYGFQQFGIPVSGALDLFSCRVANLLVGNPENAAVLEITFIGPKLEALSEGVVALTGADMPLHVNGKSRALWEAIPVKAGDRISLKAAAKGVRAYLAVSGGVLVPEVMGSRSTCIGGRFGGMKGRALAAGDILERGAAHVPYAMLRLPDEFRPEFRSEITLRALPGPQDDYFDKGLELFLSSQFTVTPQADRMGYRLDGPVITLKEGMPTSIISEPHVPGAVQVPPDGRAIIVLVEQTVGGYAKIATVVSADLNILAQARPGHRVRFSRVDGAEAHFSYLTHQEKLERIRTILRR